MFLTYLLTHSAWNLGFIFDELLTFSGQISSVSKSCYYHIRQLHCIRLYLDTKTASTNATSTVHSKLVYCNSVYHNLPKSRITRLQQIQNSLARALSKPPNTVTSFPSYWLKITEHIELFHLPTKFLQPPNLHICITSSLFSILAALALHLWSYSISPSTSSSLRITDRSFQYTSRRLWKNQLPASLCQPCTNHSNSPSAMSAILSLAPSIHHSSSIHSSLKTLPFLQILPTVVFLSFYRTDSMDSPDCCRYFWVYPFLLFISSFLPLFIFLVPCSRLSWLMSACKHTLK